MITPEFKALPQSTIYTAARSLVKPYPYLHRTITPIIPKQILIIGVHGFFPNKMFRPLIGEPTGTSMRFASVAESAVVSWAAENNLQIQIQKLALEREGKIQDRVDFFFELLKKTEINADFIFVACHSQGCPVSIMLIAKLLEYGLINSSRIGVLAMAGINIGPFYGLDKSLFMRAYSTIENDSMMELFQYQNFESLHSRKYLDALNILLEHDVKITFVGSIDDQLVPLYSALAIHIQHPNFFKSVYIDDSTNTPDFLARMIKLSCDLLNKGSTDHDLIKEISPALAGPITGGGHSRVYNDINVYKLALDIALKTTSTYQPIKYKPFDIKKLGPTSNPYMLPWCARGMFYEAKKTKTGNEEILRVFDEFDEWDPQSKVLKDVKYRLNGIKSNL